MTTQQPSTHLARSPDPLGCDHAAWAATYAASGLPVFPLHWITDTGTCSCPSGAGCGRSAGKHPMTRKGHLDATTDAEQIRQWWQRWPLANIGARPPQGLIVLDVDVRHQGASTLLALTHQHSPLPLTLTAITGGGGLHIWLNHTGAHRGELCPGVDVKSHRGYLVVPPSRHHSGRRYAWANQAPIARAPHWVRDLLRPTPLARTPIPARTATTGSSNAGLVRVVATATEGNRNRALYWAACRAYERHAGPDLLRDLITAAVAAGLPEREARVTINSAARTVAGGAAQ